MFVTLCRRLPLALIWCAAAGATAVLASDATVSPKRVLPPAAQMPTLPSAEIDDTLAIGGTEIDGRKIASRMTVQVRVNGTGPYKFVVDSGADTSVVGERIAAILKLPLGRRVILNSITDTQMVSRVLVDEIELGPTKVTNLELPVLRERDLGAHGMLGLDALVEQRLMLDFEKRLITVDDGRTPAPQLEGNVIVVTARLRRGQLILTQVSADRHKLDAVVDTGSELTIGNSALREKLRRRRASFQTIEVTGVTGTTVALEIARIARLQIGGIVLQDVPIAFADIPPFQVFGLDKKPALLLGTDLMENFRKVSLDFRARKVRFQLKRCSGGIRIRTSTESLTRLLAEAPQACAS